MTVQDIRRWQCDSCTQSTEERIRSDRTVYPRGWVCVALTDATKANYVYWWCPNCVEAITRVAPNALGEFATGWPYVVGADDGKAR